MAVDFYNKVSLIYMFFPLFFYVALSNFKKQWNPWMLKLIFRTFTDSPDMRLKPFLVKMAATEREKRKKYLLLRLSGVFWVRNSQVATATTAWESQRAIWKAKWVIDDRSQLSPRGSCQRRRCRVSVTHHLPLTNNQQLWTAAQPERKHCRQSIWQAALTLPLPPHALIVGRKPLPFFFFYKIEQPGKIDGLIIIIIFLNYISLILCDINLKECKVWFDNYFCDAVFSTACSRERGFNNGFILLCKRADFSCCNGLRKFALTKRLCYSA